MKEKGLRFNEGKDRIDLVPESAINGIAKVLTFGARKYAENNWRLGMKWSKITSSLKRHLAAIDRGEDYDQESGLLHIDHVLTNAAFLKEYYKIYPEGDDRPHNYLNPKRIGLDIDDVLADWVGAFCNLLNIEKSNNWSFGFPEKVKYLIDSGTNYSEVMANLPVKTKPEDLPFEPVCYVTNRSHTDVSIAEKWIEKNGFPQVPVIQTSDKIQACKDMNVDIFVDDSYINFVNLNNAGICCYLFDTPHNQRYQVGYKRLYKLKDLA